MRTAIVLLLAACSQAADPPADTVRVDISRKGGFSPTPAAGSTCTPMDDSYTLTIATQILTWQRCESQTAGGIYTPTPGQATLDDPAFEMLSIAIDNLHAVQPPCDGDLIDTFVFTTGSGVTTLAGVQCDANDPAVFELLSADAH